MKHFRLSFFVTLLCLLCAGWWGHQRGGTAGGLSAIGVVAILAVMEVSLSFDNAVVNAAVLKTWSAFWKRLFLGVGILIAVFGMRLLFPLLIVGVAADLGIAEVWRMALDTPQEYALRLTEHHAEVAAFGSMFLLLVFLNFLLDEEKKHHWLGRFEEALGSLSLSQWSGCFLGWLTLMVAWTQCPDSWRPVLIGATIGIGVALHSDRGWLSRPGSVAAMLAVIALTAAVALAPELRDQVWYAGMAGIAVYIGVDVVSGLLEGGEEADGQVGKVARRGGVAAFLYLEVLDASFSFDGVIGAFAITSDIVIIMLGLAIGAMFVRSLTVFLVEKGALDEFIYLEHGAHYAIGILALIMLASLRYHIPELVTGAAGVAFIGASLWSSIRYRRSRQPAPTG